MSRAAQRNNAAERRPGEEDDICPVCKTSRYLNPSMKFLVNPECYHKMCESCVDRIFSQGPAPCPVAGCHRTLRKHRFRKQTFGDIQVEKEVDVRKKVAQTYDSLPFPLPYYKSVVHDLQQRLTGRHHLSFNRRQDEFTSLLSYNNYLEEVETITFNLLNRIDLSATEAKLAAYSSQNATSISHNADLQSQEAVTRKAREAHDKEQARLRREAARREESEGRREIEEGKREVISKLASGSGDALQIAQETQKVILKRSTARRTEAEKAAEKARAAGTTLAANSSNGSADPAFMIQGLKPAAKVEPEKPYDPFAGYQDEPQYFTLQEHYENPWLDNARKDPHITAGGFDVKEYYARTLFEAFSGLGCFIEDEMGGRNTGSSKGVATISAAAAAVSGDGDEDTAMSDTF
ncbi:MAG: TFIIH/NER complex subunit [Pycnora praestabilis]|nr:MAG: TFIIH/NER complex subunit [Pycnora praestabilis]